MSKKLVTPTGKWDIDIEPGADIENPPPDGGGSEVEQHIYVTITDIDSGETYEGKLYEVAVKNKLDYLDMWAPAIAKEDSIHDGNETPKKRTV